MSRGIAIFLCDITGVMSLPWVESGYDVILIDPQHPEGVGHYANYNCGHVHLRTKDRKMFCETCDADGVAKTRAIRSNGSTTTKVGYIIDSPATWTVLREAIQTGRVVFVVGFPPCTDVAVSGTPQFARKFAADKHYQAKAALVAEQCYTIGKLSGAPGFFENPISVLSSIMGKPTHIFSPYQYTGFCEGDNYFKSTCLWPYNDFKMPEAFMIKGVKLATEIVYSVLKRLPSDKKKMLAEHGHKFCAEFLDVINEFYPDDRIHKCSPGKNRANFRSETPYGFSKAVFLNNAPHLKLLEIDRGGEA